MAPSFNQTIVDESTSDGVHTIIIHLSLPRPQGIAASQTSIHESHDVLEPHQGVPVAGTCPKKPVTEFRNENPTTEIYDEKPVTDGNTNGHPQKALYTPDDLPPPSRFQPKCHPRADEVCAELDAFFATYWPWENEKARQKFIAADTNRWACWSFPLVRDDRIVNAVKVDTLLFLLDDVAESMSFEDGKRFYQRLILLAKGKFLPDRENAYEWITYDTFASMRADDEALTEIVLREAMLCVNAQVDEARNHVVGMGALLKQRYKEGGIKFVAAVLRYGMDLHISEANLESLKDIEESYSRLGICVNDIHSFEKEVRAYAKHKSEGAKVLNMVQMQALETGVSYACAKRILWVLCREWELQHIELIEQREMQLNLEGQEGKGEMNEDLRLYLKALEYTISGNEKWSEYTKRYYEELD